jgi:type II secretory pathway predicted ATPase ExeA
MYEEYWGLKEKPFENTPDPRFLYYSPQHEEALSRLMYIVKERKGAGMLTGVFGCGKTLLAHALLKELGGDIYRIVLVNNPKLSHIELLMDIALKLGASGLPAKKTELLANLLLDSLNEILENNLRDGRETVVIIDEAHMIKDEDVWDELRLLLNFQTESRFLLTLLLMGQPELQKIIEANKPLLQRITIKSHLESLSPADTSAYVKHRLKIAGREKEIFTPGAISLIYEKSGGIPRRINQVCDMSLFAGFGEKVKSIDEKIIQEVMKDSEE